MVICDQQEKKRFVQSAHQSAPQYIYSIYNMKGIWVWPRLYNKHGVRYSVCSSIHVTRQTELLVLLDRQCYQCYQTDSVTSVTRQTVLLVLLDRQSYQCYQTDSVHSGQSTHCPGQREQPVEVQCTALDAVHCRVLQCSTLQ